MFEILFIAIVWMPYIIMGKTFKMMRNYCKKRNWIFLGDVIKVIGFPFSLYDDVY